MSVTVEFIEHQRVEVDGVLQSYPAGTTAGVSEDMAKLLVAKGVAKIAAPKQPVVMVQPYRGKVAVILLQRYKQLNPGETAGFPPDETEELIQRGIAKRAPRIGQPLVNAALRIKDDKEIQRLAMALDRLGSWEDREQQQTNLRADIKAIEQTEAKALALGETLPADLTERKRLMVEHLLKVEKELQILTEQYQPLLAELQAVISTYIRRKWQAALATNVEPVLKELFATVKKAARIFDALDLTALDELRSLAVTSEMDQGELDAMLAGVVREIVGADTLTSPFTGRTSIGDLVSVLYGLAVAHQQTRTSV